MLLGQWHSSFTIVHLLLVSGCALGVGPLLPWAFTSSTSGKDILQLLLRSLRVAWTMQPLMDITPYSGMHGILSLDSWTILSLGTTCPKPESCCVWGGIRHWFFFQRGTKGPSSFPPWLFFSHSAQLISPLSVCSARPKLKMLTMCLVNWNHRCSTAGYVSCNCQAVVSHRVSTSSASSWELKGFGSSNTWPRVIYTWYQDIAAWAVGFYMPAEAKPSSSLT